VSPGQLGENVTTRGLDLLGLATGTRLHLGDRAIVEVTGLRTPCRQLEGIHEGLQAAVLDRDADGQLVRKAGIMSIVVESGTLRAGDPIAIELPARPHRPLQPV
jgi:MOSC domain-containing protein YiiM